MDINIEEALKTALEMEEMISRLYQNKADALISPVAKKIFAVLAEEEKGHIDYLQHKLEEWQQSGTITVKKLTSVVPNKEVIDKLTQKLSKDLESKDADSDIEAFRQALELEKRISMVYRDLVDKIAPEFKSFFEEFIEIEEGHTVIIQAELFSAKASGVFFDFLEFDQEAG